MATDAEIKILFDESADGPVDLDQPGAPVAPSPAEKPADTNAPRNTHFSALTEAIKRLTDRFTKREKEVATPQSAFLGPPDTRVPTDFSPEAQEERSRQRRERLANIFKEAERPKREPSRFDQILAEKGLGKSTDRVEEKLENMADRFQTKARGESEAQTSRLSKLWGMFGRKRERAPEAGTTVDGKDYKAGQFLPAKKPTIPPVPGGGGAVLVGSMAARLAAKLGPIGITVGVVTTALVGLGVATGLASRKFNQLGERLARFSGPISSVQAQARARSQIRQVRLARDIGPNVAGVMDSSARFSGAVQELKDTFTREAVKTGPIWEAILDYGTATVDGLNEVAKTTAEMLNYLVGNEDTKDITALLEGLLGLQKDEFLKRLGRDDPDFARLLAAPRKAAAVAPNEPDAGAVGAFVREKVIAGIGDIIGGI